MGFLWTFLVILGSLGLAVLFLAPFAAGFLALAAWGTEGGSVWRALVALVGMVTLVAFASASFLYVSHQAPSGWQDALAIVMEDACTK